MTEQADTPFVRLPQQDGVLVLDKPSGPTSRRCLNALKAMGQKKYANGFAMQLHEDCLDEPFALRSPHTIFVCSMSDLFHQDVPFSFVDKVMDTIRRTPQHRYQLLTKRADRMAEYFLTHDVLRNRITITTVGSHGIVGIRHGNDSGNLRNILTGKSLRIATSVISFMMIPCSDGKPRRLFDT